MESVPTRNIRPPSTQRTPSHRMIALAICSALLVLLADQITKNGIVENYSPNQLIAGSSFASLVFVTNTGGICGYAQGANTLLTGVGLITSAVIGAGILFAMPSSLPYAIGFGFLLAGALGNLIDRLRFGFVIDFVTLDFLGWPSFNIADASIMVGIALIGFLTLWETISDRRESTDAESQPFGRNTVIFLIVAGLLFALAYYSCVFRPFG